MTIGISLSTSQSTLSASSEEAFYIVVTARILTSPHPERAITLWTHLSPLDNLHTRAFANIECITTSEAKPIRIFPNNWPHYIWDSEHIRKDDCWRFVTIPPRGQGTFLVRHPVPLEAIRDAEVSRGERYRAKLTDICLGTRWWTFGTLEDLEGVRLRMWRSKADEEAEAEEERSLLNDPEGYEVIEKENEERFGKNYREMPSSMGEEPKMLAMVPEVGEVEFEVI